MTRFAPVLSCPPTERGGPGSKGQSASAAAAAANPLEETLVKENIYMESVMYDECACGYKTQTLL